MEAVESMVELTRFKVHEMDTSSRFFSHCFLCSTVCSLFLLLIMVVQQWCSNRHLSDSQSFPSESKVYPLLAQNGAWLWPEAAYSIEQMQGLVAYAQQRGVSGAVVPVRILKMYMYFLTTNSWQNILRAAVFSVVDYYYFTMHLRKLFIHF